MDLQLLVKTNSKIILDYVKMEYGNYLSSEKIHIFGYYFPIKSTQFDRLRFPLDSKTVWAKSNGEVFYKNGKYYGIYHSGLVKGIYNTKTNTILNLVRDPSRYFNICVGVVDYLFSKVLLQQAIFRIHAACVSKDNKATLICGTKGAGKTTLLMKLLEDDYHFVADDQVYLRLENEKLYCFPFPKTIKIIHSDIKNLPYLYKKLKYSTIITSHGIQKSILKPEDSHIPVDTHKLPINQIILPVISTTNRSIFKEIKKIIAFNLLNPSFRGDDLLNIDYLNDSILLNKQIELCKKALQFCAINIFEIGKDFQEINMKNFIK